jgi:hypothetical protein
MDEAAAVVAEPTAEQAPAAEPEKREPVNPRNFAERMRQLGYEKRDEEQKAKAEPDEEAEAAEEPAKPKPKVVDADPELEQLKQLAQKKGYVIDGEKVSLEEYQKFRDHKRKWHESTQAQLKAERDKLEAEKKELLGEVEWAKQVKAARAAGDLDKLAQLHGWKDYNDQQQEAINRFADPNYARLRELERAHEERAAAEKKAADDAAAQQQATEQQQVIQTYCQGLSKKMGESKDPLVKEFHDNPEFVWAIYQIQLEHWDGQTTIDPEQAVKNAARGASRTIRENMKAQYERLKRAADAGAFGAPEQPKPKVIPPKTKAPATPRAEASGRGKWGSDTDFRKHAMERLTEAIEEDRRNGIV